jgi:hypothetical protein
MAEVTIKLSQDLQDSLEGLRAMYNIAFRDGVAITPDELKSKIANGTITVEEGVVARLYAQGYYHDDVKAWAAAGVPKEDLEKMQKLQETFGDARTGEKQTQRSKKRYKTLIDNVKKVGNVSLNTYLADKSLQSSWMKKNYVGSVGLGISRDIDNIKSNAIFKTGKLKLGTRIFTGAIPGIEVVQTILQKVSQVEDPQMKRAVFAALFGQRSEALMNMKTDKNAATLISDLIRPYYENGVINNPTDDASVRQLGGRKGLPPTVKVGPLFKLLLDEQAKSVGTGGDLFGIKPLKLQNFIRDNIHNTNGVSNYPQEILDKLGKKPNNYTDLRRIFASVLINEVANKTDDLAMRQSLMGYANELLGHKTDGAVDNTLFKVMSKFYAKRTEVTKGAITVDDVPRLFERFMAEAIGAVDKKGNFTSGHLAAKLQIDAPAEWSHIYDTKNLSGDAVAIKVNKSTQTDIANTRVESKKSIDLSVANKDQTTLLDTTQKSLQVGRDIQAGAEEGIEIDPKTGKLKNVEEKLDVETEDFIKEEIKKYNEKEALKKKALKVAKKTPGAAGAGLSAYFAVDYALKPKEAFAEEAWGGFLANQAMVKGATVAAEGAGVLLPVDAPMLGLGTEEEMIEQREATEKKKEKLAEERETFAVAPGSPEAGYIPAEIDRRARDVKELDSQKDQEFINRARFIKQAEEMENLGF